MSKAFVDATVVCNAIPLPSVFPGKTSAARSILANYTDVEVPFYALKELRVGPLASLMLFHNLLVISKTIPEALHEYRRKYAFTPRKWGVSSEVIINVLLGVMEQRRIAASSGSGPSSSDDKTDLEDGLSRDILKAWRRRRSVAKKMTQPLPCFVDGELGFVGRQLRVEPKGVDEYECASGARCGAALELHRHSKEVEILIKALKSPKGKGQKTESSTRRKVLKELLAKPAAEFSKKSCRALGDAYYCIMSPPGADIVTTNMVDFQLLAGSLQKTVVQG